MRSIFLLLLLLIAFSSFAVTIDSLSPRRAKPSTWIGNKVEAEEDDKFYFKRHVQPHSIKALVDYCDAQWMQEEKDSFQRMPEEKAIEHDHYWYDSWISLRTILVMDSGVATEFKSKGIDHYNDMWEVILTLLHRKLNHQNLDMDDEIRYVKGRLVRK